MGVKCRGGRAPLVCLGCVVLDHCQNLSSKGGELEQDIAGVVGRIARRREVSRGIATRSNVRDQPRWSKPLQVVHASCVVPF